MQSENTVATIRCSGFRAAVQSLRLSIGPQSYSYQCWLLANLSGGRPTPHEGATIYYSCAELTKVPSASPAAFPSSASETSIFHIIALQATAGSLVQLAGVS